MDEESTQLKGRTISNAIKLGVTEDIVLMPVCEIAYLGQEGRREAFSEGGIVNRLDIHVVKDLEVPTSLA